MSAQLFFLFNRENEVGQSQFMLPSPWFSPVLQPKTTEVHCYKTVFQFWGGIFTFFFF